eukprot:g2679.t1
MMAFEHSQNRVKWADGDTERQDEEQSSDRGLDEQQWPAGEEAPQTEREAADEQKQEEDLPRQDLLEEGDKDLQGLRQKLLEGMKVMKFHNSNKRVLQSKSAARVLYLEQGKEDRLRYGKSAGAQDAKVIKLLSIHKVEIVKLNENGTSSKPQQQRVNLHIDDAELAFTMDTEAETEAVGRAFTRMVFVIHYTPLTDRKQALTKRFAELGIDAEWIEVMDGNALPAGTMDRHFSRFRYINKSDQEHMHFSVERMLDSELSVALKHYHAFEQIVKRRIPRALVLEDDVMLRDDFREQLASYIDQVDEHQWDMLTIGAGLFGDCRDECQQRAKGANVYRKMASPRVPSHVLGYKNLFRSLDAYVLTLACATELHQHILPLTFPMDCMLNYVLKARDMKVYWSEPVQCYREVLKENLRA